MLFEIKKLLGSLFSPLCIALFFMLLGFILFYKKPSLAFTLFGIAFVLLLVSSTPYTANHIMKDREWAYAPASASHEEIQYIVVLGSYYSGNANLPALSKLSTHGLQRVTEAVRLSRLYPDAKILFSGGSFGRHKSYASQASAAAKSLGVVDSRIIVEERAIDTYQESMYVKDTVGNSKVLLVTSANHMERSLKYFIQNKVNVVPAPAGYFVKADGVGMSSKALIPNADKLKQTEAYFYESLGMLWKYLKRD